MASINYYLKKAALNGQSLISLYFRYGNHQVVLSTNNTILPKHWDHKLQKAKAGHMGYAELNANLEKWKNEVFKIYQQRIFHELSIAPPDLKSNFEKVVQVHKFIEKPKEELKDLIAFIENYIEVVAASKNPNTLKTYRSHLRMLRLFKEKKFKKSLLFDDVTLDFYQELKGFMVQEMGYNDNTQNKHTGIIKFFLNEAAERKLHNNFDYRFKSFSTARKEVDSIYLNKEEIKILENLNLSDQPKLDMVRDLFLLACYTGLRYSDFSTIGAENIVGNGKFLKIETLKTGEIVEIPIQKGLKRILEKYEGQTQNSLPKAISNQKMNLYLKEIGQMANFLEEVAYMDNRNNKKERKKALKFEKITCHTARRSFATNEYLEGTPIQLIMSITGHVTEKAFLKYIKVTRTQKAISLLKIWEERDE